MAYPLVSKGKYAPCEDLSCCEGHVRSRGMRFKGTVVVGEQFCSCVVYITGNMGFWWCTCGGFLMRTISDSDEVLLEMPEIWMNRLPSRGMLDRRV